MRLADFNTLQPTASRLLEDKIDFNARFGCTKTGDRVGWGGGFYDRFMMSNQAQLNLVLAFDCQIAEQLPTTEFDQKVDGIITESQLFFLDRA